MYELLAQAYNYIRMVWRFRWVALMGSTMICLGGWFSVLLMPDKYEVSAKVFLDTQTLLQPILRGIALQTNVQRDAIMMMRRTLLVRPNLEAVVRKTDMDLRAETPEQMERLLSGLAANIHVEGTGKDNIFVIKYGHRDPKLATRVVDALLNLFVERSLGQSRKDTSKSREFLEAQIKEYESRLIAAENRLKEFKRQNVGLMSAGASYYSRLEALGQQLSAAMLELREAEQRRDAIKGQLNQVSELLETASPDMTAIPHPLDKRIAELESSLDQLLLQYTERHPDVVATKSMVDMLKTQREEELAALAKDPKEAEQQHATNPVYQELKVALGAVEAEIAALNARVEEYKSREVGLKELVDTVPKIEAELVKLNRDYDIDRQNYDALVKRREALKISDDASQSTDDVQFNIIEPPKEPLVPTSPDRPKLNLGVLLVGLAGGVGFALLLGLLRPAIYTKEGFAEITDLPVLGAVTRVWTRREMFRRRMEIATFALGCVCLLSVYVGLSFIEAMDLDLVSKMAALRERLI